LNQREWIFSERTRRLIHDALEEDVGSGDYSSLWSVPREQCSSAKIIARAGGVLAGIPVARYLLDLIDPPPVLISSLEDGASVAAGQVIAQLEGQSQALLKVERTLLNFIQRLSGVATMTRSFMEKVEGTGVRILDTRKTTPGFRELEKYAVRVGGGSNHRIGLFDYVLLKENHIAAAGGISRAVEVVKKRNALGLEIEVETRTLDEVHEAARAGVNRIMLDNMTVEQMKTAVDIIRNHCEGSAPEIEASGDVNLRTVASIAATGVDFISVGALTHSSGILNLSMLIEASD
jgi:nicotinate-nucleotide pyrophosphorylase (carboxylating)